MPVHYESESDLKPDLERWNIEPFLARMRTAAIQKPEGRCGNSERKRDVCISRAHDELRRSSRNSGYRLTAAHDKLRKSSLVHIAAGRADPVFRNGALTIDYAAGCAYLGGEELRLTPIEYRLLCLLAQNVGKVLTHKYITQHIWGVGWENNIGSLRVFMATLRKKLETGPDSPSYIQTHIGVGYRMIKVD